MEHEIIIEKTASNGQAKKVCIDGTWYPSLSKIPMFSYNSIYGYRKNHGLTTEEAIDGLLVYYENAKKRKSERLAKEEENRQRISSKFIYHGEGFSSFAQAIRIMSIRNKVPLDVSKVYNFTVRNNLDKQSGLDLYLEKVKKAS